MNFETSIFIRMNLQHPQHFKPFGFLCSGSFVFVYQTPLVFVKTLADIEFCFFAIVCLPETSERCIPYKVHLDNNQPQIKDKSSQRSKSIYQGIITETYKSRLSLNLEETNWVLGRTDLPVLLHQALVLTETFFLHFPNIYKS